MVNNYVGKWKQRRTVGVPGSKRGHNQQGMYVNFVLKFKGFYCYLKYWKIYIETNCNLLLLFKRSKQGLKSGKAFVWILV